MGSWTGAGHQKDPVRMRDLEFQPDHPPSPERKEGLATEVLISQATVREPASNPNHTGLRALLGWWTHPSTGRGEGAAPQLQGARSSP